MSWESIDIVASCLDNNIALRFRPEKRFYRVRFKDGCGIFDLRTHSIIRTNHRIFDKLFEKQYRNAGNTLSAIDRLARLHLVRPH
jgi:hypothetical protein